MKQTLFCYHFCHAAMKEMKLVIKKKSKRTLKEGTSIKGKGGEGEKMRANTKREIKEEKLLQMTEQDG